MVLLVHPNGSKYWRLRYRFGGKEKMRTPHLVSLSRQAQAILEKIKSISGNRELIFVGDHDPREPMSENAVNKALRVMDYDTKTEMCGHGFRTMACSSLIESGLWSRDAVERWMSHQERSSVRGCLYP